MRLVKLSFFSLIAPVAAGGLWFTYGAWLESACPRVQLQSVSALTAQNERALPFFELMSPLPVSEKLEAVPKLEYKKGPPDRYIERISVLFSSDSTEPKERITYYGRHSRTDLTGISLFPEENGREAHYLETALRLSQGEAPAQLPAWKLFVLKPFLLREATHWLEGAETAYIMDQAGTPAFLFMGAPSESEHAHATALFVRRNSFYRVDYLADRQFALLDPLSLFRKSFLTEKRADALDYLARNLSEVHMASQESQQLTAQETAWPILLLAANVSVDPSSLEAYFHFAGISALLYRSEAMDSSDLETFDALRNNVLASGFYAKDVNPDSDKTAAIARLARLLTRNFDQ